MPTYSGGSAEIEIDPSFEGFIAELETFLDGVDATLDIRVDVDDAQARARLDEVARDRTARVKVIADTTGFDRDVDRSTKERTRPVKVPVGADLDLFQRDLLRQLDGLSKSAEARVPLTADGERLRRSIRDEVAAVASQIRLPIPAGATEAAAWRQGLQSAIGDVGRDFERQMQGLESAAAGPLGSVTQQMGQLGSGVAAVGGEFGQLSGVILGGGLVLLPGLLTAAAGAMAGLVEAAGAGVGILGAVGATIGVGGSGIIGALKAMREANADGGKAIQDSADKERDALDAVMQAHARVTDAQHTEQTSLTAVTDAQHEHQLSLQRVKDSQTSLTEARRSARDELDNLALAERRGVLSERGATLSYERSRVNLQKVVTQRARGEATDLDVREAQYQVDESSQNITDVRVRNAQQSRGTATANAKGVEGNDSVVRAQAALVESQYGVVRSQQAIATANFNVVRSQQSVVEAVHGLERAQRQYQDASSAAAAGTDKLRQALAGLSPEGRKFVEQMNALFPLLERLRNPVQDNLVRGLGDSITHFAQDQAPLASRAMSNIAGEVNGTLRTTLSGLDSMLQRMAADGTLDRFLDAIGRALHGLPPLVEGVVSAFIHFTERAGPDLGELASKLGGFLSGLSGELGHNLLDALIKLSGPLSEFLGKLFGPGGIGPQLPELATHFGNLLIQLAPLLIALTRLATNALPLLINVMRPAVETLTAVADIFSKIFGWVDRLIEKLDKLTHNNAWTVIGGLINPSGVAFGALGKVLGRSTGGTVPGSGPDHVDTIPSMLAPGEFVVRTAMARKYAPLVQAINDDTVLGLASGGPAVARASTWAAGQAGQGYVFGGLDCSMYASGAYQELIGGDPGQRAFDTTAFATPSSAAALGFQPGVFGNYSVGVIPLPGEQGHMAFRLGGTPGESASGKGVVFGANAADVNDSMFTVQYSLPGSLFKPPEAAGSSAQQQAAGAAGAPSTNPGDYSSTGTYTGPGGPSVDQSGATNGDLSQSQDKDDLSIQGFFRKGADILSGGILSAFGADNSILSNTNPWNKAITQLSNANKAIPGGIHVGPPPPGSIPPFAPLFGSGTPVPGATTNTPPGPTQYVPGSPSPAPNPYAYGAPPTTPQTSGTTPAHTSPGTTPTTPGYSGPSYANPNPATGYTSGVANSSPSYSRSTTSGSSPSLPSSSGVRGTSPGPLPKSGARSSGTNPPAAHTYQPGGGVEQWRSTVVEVLSQTGRNPAEADRVLAQMRFEDATGDPGATNDWDSNAANGTPSKGLMQVIEPTFDTYRDSRFPGGLTDPKANIAAALNYAEARYNGSIDNIWPTAAGYVDGGWITGPGGPQSDAVPLWGSNGEFMVKAAAASANADWLQQINAGAVLSAAPAVPAGLSAAPAPAVVGGSRDFHSTINARVASVDDLAQLANRQAERQSMGMLAALP